MVVKDINTDAFEGLLFQDFCQLYAGFVVPENIERETYQFLRVFYRVKYGLERLLFLPEEGNFIAVSKMRTVEPLNIFS